MSGGRPVLWDVDTQVDFVLPHGKLCRARRRGRRADRWRGSSRWAREAGIAHVASADDHELDRPRARPTTPTSATPILRTACAGHPARRRSPRRRRRTRCRCRPSPLPPGHVTELDRGRREILLLKKSFDVFTNPNAEPLVERLAPSEVILFGVATDVCDHAAITGLRAAVSRVAFVEDAARGLVEERVRPAWPIGARPACGSRRPTRSSRSVTPPSS